MSVLAPEDICPFSAADMCPVSTADIYSVSTETSVLSKSQASKLGFRRPRQLPTKAMLVKRWLSEAAVAADQRVSVVPWTTQVWQPNKIDTAKYVIVLRICTR